MASWDAFNNGFDLRGLLIMTAEPYGAIYPSEVGLSLSATWKQLAEAHLLKFGLLQPYASGTRRDSSIKDKEACVTETQATA